ncbi:MAG: DNA polymerase III subunit beta [Parachlamydiales bacterium]|jgi:DNA polymerase-3 subunit beta
MKAVISKQELVDAISKIQTLISSKPAIPILANILIEALNDQLVISATDLTTSMRTTTSAKVIEPGSIALPARKFFQLVREITAPQLKISLISSETAEILAGSSVFKIKGMHKNEFPSIADFTGKAQINFEPGFLKEVLAKTSFAAAKDDSRYVLNGLYLQIQNGEASFIGTDGKRLAKTQTKIDLDAAFQGAYIIPLKAVEEMIRMLDEKSATAALSLTPDRVFLENGPLMLTTKLLSGQYPDVERVIPTASPISLSLHREELAALLRQVSLFTSDTSGSVKFSFADGSLLLTANSSEIGEGVVSMPVDYHKEKLEIAFNPHFFLDILRHSKDEILTFALSDSYNPGVIIDSKGSFFVIMPMRLNESVETAAEENAAFNPALT